MENKAQSTSTFEISAVNSCHILKISTEPFVFEPAKGGGGLVGDRNTASLVSTQCCTVLYGDHVINLRYGRVGKIIRFLVIFSKVLASVSV